MGQIADEVRVTGAGHIYVADVDTPFPTNISAEVDLDDWAELGYVSEAGARFSFGREINNIMAWQKFDPIRKVVTALPKSVAFDLMQWNQHTVKLALGGGTVSGTTPNFEYEPPAESFLDQRALIIEGIDGDFSYRFCYRKALNESGVDFAFVRADPVLFPITMGVLAADDDDPPFIIQTDDPNIGELAEAGS